ncbi:uncharacterized protein METZ01_LOCUS71534, partial [marine metagenome]
VKTARPHAVVIKIQGVICLDALVLFKLTLATIPFPRNNRIAVPINSAI